MGSVLSELPNCRVLSRLSLGMIVATQVGIAPRTRQYLRNMLQRCATTAGTMMHCLVHPL